jgi:malate dehydrogenase (oxaloacetate-decarboxylating)
VLLDSRGVITKDRADIAADPVSKQAQPAARSNLRGVAGDPGEALLGADVFIGVSPSKLDEEHLKLMNHSAIVFALSKPDPEGLPELAAKYAAVADQPGTDQPGTDQPGTAETGGGP